MARIVLRAAEREKIVDQIARMLWESGEMLADSEGGSMPTWDEVRAGCVAQTEGCWDWYLAHKRRAEAVLALDAAQSLALARILLDRAARQYRELELDLWAKIERAKGFEPGSLTGEPGVRQEVAL